MIYIFIKRKDFIHIVDKANIGLKYPPQFGKFNLYFYFSVLMNISYSTCGQSKQIKQ
jgi:hypothetical protein